MGREFSEFLVQSSQKFVCWNFEGSVQEIIRVFFNFELLESEVQTQLDWFLLWAFREIIINLAFAEGLRVAREVVIQ